MDMVKTINMDGKRYEFICRSWGTRSGFAHGCEMVDMENYTIMADNKVFYLNRTWECWDFQTAIKGAIGKAMAERREIITDRVRDVNGWKKITKQRREALDRALAIDPEYHTLSKVLEEVGKNRPAWAC